ncbi:MAG: cation:proton antiporter, partial [Rhodothermales bacterium]
MHLDLFVLLIVLLAAWVAGALASRLGFSSAIGALVAGIVLGPPVLGFLSGSPALSVLAEVGALLMMLYLGTEIDPRKLGPASWSGLLAAIGGFVL